MKNFATSHYISFSSNNAQTDRNTNNQHESIKTVVNSDKINDVKRS